MGYRGIVAACGALIVAGVGIFLYQHQAPATTIDSLREDIAALGPGAAYAAAVSSIAGLPVPEQHTYMHLFGEALYAEEGVEGFSVCDDQFSYGCAHQFIGMAISEQGLAAITDLARACAGAYGHVVGGCLHAMGHGIQSYFGYERGHLDQALAACDAYLGYTDITKRSCYWGVFMEYNARRMLSAEGDARPVPPENPFTPCDEFSGLRGEACYFILPRWWWWDFTDTGKTDQKEIFSQIAARCARAPADMHDACIQGIAGTAVFFLSDSPQERAHYCTIGIDDRADQVMCIQHVALWLARYLPTQHGTAYTPAMACEGLSGHDLTACLGYASAPAD
jgi:hypothetical protein